MGNGQSPCIAADIAQADKAGKRRLDEAVEKLRLDFYKLGASGFPYSAAFVEQGL